VRQVRGTVVEVLLEG